MLEKLDSKEIRITGEYLRVMAYDMSRQTLYQPIGLYDGYVTEHRGNR